jgi:hypothetical protein
VSLLLYPADVRFPRDNVRAGDLHYLGGLPMRLTVPPRGPISFRAGLEQVCQLHDRLLSHLRHPRLEFRTRIDGFLVAPDL